MPDTDEFVSWAMAPERTLEERFAVEKAIEWGVRLDRIERKLPDPHNWEREREIQDARRLNPAYVPQLKPDDLHSGAAGLRLRKDYSTISHRDRPMRDLKWLRFFPHFEQLGLNELEVDDYSPLAALPNLRKLNIQDDQTIDLRPLGQCAALEELSIRVRQPWVKIDGLDRLERLHTVHWLGSPLILQAIPRWPAVRHAVLKEFCVNFPLRDAFQLPEMPLLEVLELESIFSLEGLERYPRLVNLKVAGFYRDLRPLTACRALTHLWLQLSIHLELDVLREVAPLATLPELRYLQVRSQRPRDYSALAEAPRLHQLSLMRSLIEPLQSCAMEQATLNASFEPWDNEFLLPAPRPLAPLRVGYFETNQPDQYPKPPPWSGPPPAWDQNPGFRESEGRWLEHRLAARLLALFDDDEHWGEVRFSFYAIAPQRHLGVTLKSQEAAERLSEVIQSIRTELAWLPCPWIVDLGTRLELPPVNNPRVMAEIERQREAADEEYYEQKRKEEAEFLERKHRLELQQEAGAKIRPEDFAAPGAKPPPKDADDNDDEADDDEDSGDTATEQLEDQSDDFESDRPHPLADRYFFGGTVREDGAWFYDHFRGIVEYLLGGKTPP